MARSTESTTRAASPAVASARRWSTAAPTSPAQSDRLGHDSGVGLDAVAQRCEVRRVGDRPRLRGGAGEQELAELLAVVVLPDERPDVLAGGAVVAFGDQIGRAHV